MEDKKIDPDSNSSIEDKIKAYEKIAEELIDECDANKIVAHDAHALSDDSGARIFLFSRFHTHILQ